MAKKIRMCKTDTFLKTSRPKINRKLTIYDVLKILTLINKGFSQSKIYYITGYNYFFIRNVTRLYNFLQAYLPKNDLDTAFTDETTFISTLIALVKNNVAENRDDFMIDMFNTMLHIPLQESTTEKIAYS